MIELIYYQDGNALKKYFLFSSSFLLGIKRQLENFREATNSVLDLVIIMTQKEIKMVYFHKDKVTQLRVIGW